MSRDYKPDKFPMKKIQMEFGSSLWKMMSQREFNMRTIKNHFDLMGKW